VSSDAAVIWLTSAVSHTQSDGVLQFCPHLSAFYSDNLSVSKRYHQQWNVELLWCLPRGCWMTVLVLDSTIWARRLHL